MGVVDDERNAACAELVAAVAKEKSLRDALTGQGGVKLAAIKRCQDADITITEIAGLAKVGRDTIYRWIEAKP